MQQDRGRREALLPGPPQLLGKPGAQGPRLADSAPSDTQPRLRLPHVPEAKGARHEQAAGIRIGCRWLRRLNSAGVGFSPATRLRTQALFAPFLVQCRATSLLRSPEWTGGTCGTG